MLVVDRLPLIAGQFLAGVGRLRDECEAARFHGLGVYHPEAQGTTGPSVHPGRGALEDHIGAIVQRRPEFSGLNCPPPDRPTPRKIPVVGPHQEVEPFPQEREPVSEPPGWGVLDFRAAEFLLVDVQLHNDPFSRNPRPVQYLDRFGQAVLIVQQTTVHPHPDAAIDRHRIAGWYHHPAAQPVRARKGRQSRAVVSGGGQGFRNA